MRSREKEMDDRGRVPGERGVRPASLCGALCK